MATENKFLPCGCNDHGWCRAHVPAHFKRDERARVRQWKRQNRALTVRAIMRLAARRGQTFEEAEAAIAQHVRKVK